MGGKATRSTTKGLYIKEAQTLRGIWNGLAKSSIRKFTAIGNKPRKEEK
jgi:hypothetical protein